MKIYNRTINRKAVSAVIHALNDDNHTALGNALAPYRSEYAALWLAKALLDRRCKVTLPGALKLLRKFSM